MYVCANSNQDSVTIGRCTQPTLWVHLEYPAWVIGEAESLDLTGQLLHLGHIPRQGVKAALPNTKKQTQGGCQNEETKKQSPNGRTDKNSRNRAKQNGDKQSYQMQNPKHWL